MITQKYEVEADLKSVSLADLIYLMRHIDYRRQNAEWQFLEKLIEEELIRRGRLGTFE
jgi:hypothetical protein